MSLLMARINCSISDSSKHWTEEEVVSLFKKDKTEINLKDACLIEKIQEEATDVELTFFCKKHQIEKRDILNTLSMRQS